jgi:glycolate oxidase iron-sulfur subunit
MHHTIPVETLGTDGQTMARAVEACVHCGFCLPACPTYLVLGEEMDSPRGRIVLMKSALEGRVPVHEALPFIDRCLGCLACVSACPSGVRYGEMLPLFRGHAKAHRRQHAAERVAHALLHYTLRSPARSRIALHAGQVVRHFKGLLPRRLRSALALAPDGLSRARALPAHAPAGGARRARVALLAGCVQQAVAPGIGWSTIRVLTRNGVEVVVPRGQDCCGGLALHGGELELARKLARKNLRALAGDVDAIVTNAAGCGSAMKEYGILFAGRREEDAAKALAAKVRDVSEFLADLGPVARGSLRDPLTIAYHDACHLAHGQGVTAAPRMLLRSIGNLNVVEIGESDMCCGSAGTYNLEQPRIAAVLGERKARHIAATGAGAVVTGNVGCIVQIETHLKRLGRSIPVWHVVEVLDRAYGAQHDCTGGNARISRWYTSWTSEKGLWSRV